MTSVLSNAEHEGVILHGLQKPSSTCSSTTTTTASRRTTDPLGAYSETFYGPNGGILLLNDDAGAEVRKREPAICEDPITGERRYRLRIADADLRPSFRNAIGSCALQSGVYATNGGGGV
uniref:Uncharacterized protein n=1 Tax=Plectus sambesii TaxID=2011161 RepID=A0A914XCA9_9BILA